MNYVSIKTQERSAARAATDPPASAPNLGGPAEHAAEAVLSSRSTSTRHLAEGGEEVECPAALNVSSALAVTSFAPVIVDLCGNQAVDPPVLPTSGSSLLSKRSRPETESFGPSGICLGDNASTMVKFLHESCKVSGSCSKSHSQQADSHVRFVNNVS